MNITLTFFLRKLMYRRLAKNDPEGKVLIRTYGKGSNQPDRLRSCMLENGKKLTAVVSGQMRKD